MRGAQGGSPGGSSPLCPARAPAAGSQTHPGRCRAGSAPAGTSGGSRGLRGEHTQGKVTHRPRTRSPPLSPAPEARVPPVAASALPLLMAFPAAKLRKPDVTVAPGNGFFRRREGRASCGDWRKRTPSREERSGLGDVCPEPGRRAPRRPGGLRGGGGARAPHLLSLPLGTEAAVNHALFGTQPPRRLSRAEGSSGNPQGQLPLGHGLAQGHCAVTVRATSCPTARGPLPLGLPVVE